MCVCVWCVFIKLHITAQSGPVILIIICHSYLSSQGGINDTYYYETSDQTRQRGHTLSTDDAWVVIPFILDVGLVDVPAGVTQETGHRGFLHLPCAVLALWHTPHAVALDKVLSLSPILFVCTLTIIYDIICSSSIVLFYFTFFMPLPFVYVITELCSTRLVGALYIRCVCKHVPLSFFSGSTFHVQDWQLRILVYYWVWLRTNQSVSVKREGERERERPNQLVPFLHHIQFIFLCCVYT